MKFKKQLDAKLNGYEGPIFPSNVTAINNIMKFYAISIDDLEKLIENKLHIKLISSLKTQPIDDEDLTGSFGFFYEKKDDIFKSKVIVTLPIAYDYGKAYSTAVYTKGNITDKGLAQAIDEIATYIEQSKSFKIKTKYWESKNANR
jgi:hypothetical protein